MLALLLLIKSMYLFSYGMDITITYVGLDSPMKATLDRATIKDFIALFDLIN
jgi:hypothetical protein